MADEYRNEFLTKVQHFGPRGAGDLVDAFEKLSDEDQHAVEHNLMHLHSRTWPETYLWAHIEKEGLRVDRS